MERWARSADAATRKSATAATRTVRQSVRVKDPPRQFVRV